MMMGLSSLAMGLDARANSTPLFSPSPSGSWSTFDFPARISLSVKWMSFHCAKLRIGGSPALDSV